MKILATSDLHIGYPSSQSLKLLTEYVKKEQPDVVVISGDIYDYRGVNPFYELSNLEMDNDLPVVFCLGNHEFAWRDVEFTLNHYRFNGKHFPYVHCLDTEGFVDIDGVRFVGNVLWYDGSLSDRGDKQEKLNHIDESWLDSTINDFNAVEENRKCVEQIKAGLKDYTGKSVLVTHTVPYWKLNLFNFDMPCGVYNIYSGVKDLFKNDGINVDVAICGHTHRKTRLEYTEDGKYIRCYNIGNEYIEKSGQLLYEIIEL